MYSLKIFLIFSLSFLKQKNAPAIPPERFSFFIIIFRYFFYIMPSVRLRAFRHLFRCACRDDGAAPVTAFRSHVDDVIRRLDHIQVVLDDHDGIAALCQSSQNLNQLIHICKNEVPVVGSSRI